MPRALSRQRLRQTVLSSRMTPNDVSAKVIVLFRTTLRPGADLVAFESLENRMSDLVNQIPGYLGVKSYTVADGETISIAQFASTEALLSWRNHPEHIVAQRAGRERFYAAYDARLCNVEPPIRVRARHRTGRLTGSRPHTRGTGPVGSAHTQARVAVHCPACSDLNCMLIVNTLGADQPMAKTPTVERETATFRLPSTLLERARKEGADRGLAYVRSIEEALEVYFFSRLPPPMAEALEGDIKELKVSRDNYFYSLLDARYRQLIAKEAVSELRKSSPRKK